MFRLKTRRTWNHDIRRKSLFAYLHDKGVLDDWNIEQIKIGPSFSRPTLNQRLSWTDMSSDGILISPGPGCWLVCTLQPRGLRDASLLWWLRSDLVSPAWPEVSTAAAGAGGLNPSNQRELWTVLSQAQAAATLDPLCIYYLILKIARTIRYWMALDN